MIRLFMAMMVALVSAGVTVSVASAQTAATCSQFASQAQAQAAYAADAANLAALDEDGDGIACEDVIYSDTTRDLTPVLGSGEAAPQASSGAPGIGASGIVPAASQASETAERGIGASGIAPAASQTTDMVEGGIGASGITQPRGVGAPGTVSSERGAVVGSMSGMPNTGVGTVGASAWLLPATLLVAAMGAAWASLQLRLSAARLSLHWK